MVEYVVVEFHIMTNQHVSFTVTKEPLQAFGPADAFAVEIDGEHGVVVSTHGWGYFFGSLDDDVEIRLLYILPVLIFALQLVYMRFSLSIVFLHRLDYLLYFFVSVQLIQFLIYIELLFCGAIPSINDCLEYHLAAVVTFFQLHHSIQTLNLDISTFTRRMHHYDGNQDS